MKDFSRMRSRKADALFDAHEFGWEIEEVHHWHCGGDDDELCRTILFHGIEGDTRAVRGHFYVRFKPGASVVVESCAMIDQCLVGGSRANVARRQR